MDKHEEVKAWCRDPSETLCPAQVVAQEFRGPFTLLTLALPHGLCYVLQPSRELLGSR